MWTLLTRHLSVPLWTRLLIITATVGWQHVRGSAPTLLHLGWHLAGLHRIATGSGVRHRRHARATHRGLLHSGWVLAGRCRHGWHSRLTGIRLRLLLLLRWKLRLSLKWWRSKLLGRLGLLLLLLIRLRRIVGLLAHSRHRLTRSGRSAHGLRWSILHGRLTRDHRIGWHSGLIRLLLLVTVGKAVVRSDGWSGRHSRRLTDWRRTILQRWLARLLLLRKTTGNATPRSDRWRAGRWAPDHRLVRERGLLVLEWRATERHVLELVWKVLRSPIDGRQRWWRCCRRLSYALLWPPLGRLPVRTHRGIHYQQRK